MTTRSGPARPRGRPRDPAIDEAVLDAAIAVLAAEGLDGTSMDRVAERAGVAKMTVYSRWPSKSALLGAALRHLRTGELAEPTGDVRADLVTLLDTMIRQYETVGAHSINGSCLAAEPRSTELLDTVRESTVLPRRRAFTAALEAGVRHGTVRADADLDVAVSMLVGVVHADHLAGIPTGPDRVAAVVDAVLSGLRA